MKTSSTNAYVNKLQLLKQRFCQWGLKIDFWVTVYWEVHLLHSTSTFHSCKYCQDASWQFIHFASMLQNYQLIGTTNELSDFLKATASKPPRVTADGFLLGSLFKTNFSDSLYVNNVRKGLRFQIWHINHVPIQYTILICTSNNTVVETYCKITIFPVMPYYYML